MMLFVHRVSRCDHTPFRNMTAVLTEMDHSWRWCDVRTGRGRRMLARWPDRPGWPILVGDALAACVLLGRRPGLIDQSVFLSFEMFGYQRPDEGLGAAIKNRLLRAGHLIALRRFPRVVFPNELRRRFYIDRLDGLAERSFVFPNFTTRTFGEQVSSEAVPEVGDRLTPFRAEHDVLIVYCGLIQAGRDLAVLLDALRDVGPRVGLVVAGADKTGLASRMEEASNVLFLGYLDPLEVRYVMQQADWGYAHYGNEMLNTRYCAPTKIFEYRASGLSVLANRNEALLANPVLVDRFFEAETLSRVLSTLRPREVGGTQPGERYLEDELQGLLQSLGFELAGGRE